MQNLRLESPAFPRHCDPILEALRDIFPDHGTPLRILELASGPGQHASFFASHLPHTTWVPTEKRPSMRSSIDAWTAHRGTPNVLPAQTLDVDKDDAPEHATCDGVLAVNFFHMVGPDTVQRAFHVASQALKPGGIFAVYDCFTYNGTHISPSNARFDQHLRQGTPHGRVHAFEYTCSQAALAGFAPNASVRHLPANNQVVCWIKK